MGVAYDTSGSSLIVESEHDIWKAGQRCPDLLLSSSSGFSDSIRLYSTVRYGQVSILSIGDPLRESWPTSSDMCVRYIILADKQQNAADTNTAFKCQDIQSDARYVVVVRPDMYIGYVGAETNALSYLSQLISP